MKNKIILMAGILVAVIIYGTRLQNLSITLAGSSTSKIEVKTKNKPVSFKRPMDAGRKPMKKRSFI